jgi:hypothetical protein
MSDMSSIVSSVSAWLYRSFRSLCRQPALRGMGGRSRGRCLHDVSEPTDDHCSYPEHTQIPTWLGRLSRRQVFRKHWKSPYRDDNPSYFGA